MSHSRDSIATSGEEECPYSLATTSSESSGLFGGDAEDDLYERAAAKLHHESGPEPSGFTGQRGNGSSTSTLLPG
jgi:hypothetical protein